MLKLDNLPLCGRQDELATLERIFQRGVDATNVVVVYGKSGSGKSSLVRVQQDHWTTTERALVVLGKFEREQSSGPLSAIASALNELVKKWSDCEGGDAEIESFVSNGKSKDLHLLQKFLPCLFEAAGRLLESNDLMTSKTTNLRLSGTSMRNSSSARIASSAKACDDLEHSRDGTERLKRALRRMLTAICCKPRRLVLFLDDIHWADSESLDILMFLAHANEIPGLLILVSYRDDEPSKDELVAEQVKALESKCPTHKIHLSELSVTGVNELISTIIRRDANDTLPLSEIVHEKTGGNPFAVVKCLEMLYTNALLKYSLATFKWEWVSLSTISSEVALSNDVANVVTSNMKRLPIETQQVLMVASCLATSIPIHVVTEFFKQQSASEVPGEEDGFSFLSMDEQHLISVLDSCVDASILVASEASSTIYKWSHDKVQEGAYALIPINHRTSVHLRLGKVVAKMIPAHPENEWLVLRRISWAKVYPSNQKVRFSGCS